MHRGKISTSYEVDKVTAGIKVGICHSDAQSYFVHQNPRPPSVAGAGIRRAKTPSISGRDRPITSSPRPRTRLQSLMDDLDAAKFTAE
jgi:hypothetical protein